MYRLNEFCNIIARLRKNKSMTQAVFAEKLNISPQSVSKWECGIGYPDVTMFPAIAEIMEVPINVLFGEITKEEEDKLQNKIYKINSYKADKNISQNIKVYLGNICHVEIIDGKQDRCLVKATGDTVFINYFDIEQCDDSLTVNIKNPCGSNDHWEAYDRSGYESENFVQIFTGCEDSNVSIENYLDLHATNQINEQGNMEVICKNQRHLN